MELFGLKSALKIWDSGLGFLVIGSASFVICFILGKFSSQMR